MNMLKIRFTTELMMNYFINQSLASYNEQNYQLTWVRVREVYFTFILCKNVLRCILKVQINHQMGRAYQVKRTVCAQQRDLKEQNMIGKGELNYSRKAVA